jgi:putative drug exporter of the RND superfamily
MSQRTDVTETTTGAGVYQRLGNLVTRRPIVVIGFWIVLAAVLSLALPPLAVVIGQKQAAIMPDDAPVMVATRQMVDAFHDKGTDNVLLVVLTDDKGLRPADENTYRTLVGNLRKDSADVVSLQDFLSSPEVRKVLSSEDNKAWYLPISLTGHAGSAEGAVAFENAAKLIRQTVAGSTLTAHLAGPAATAADLTAISERDLHVIEAGTAIMVLLILLIVYRNPLTMMMPLITIGISLATAQGILAGLAELGLGVSSQTMVFMSGVLFGAGTDYAVFLISRYHDFVRLGADSDQAVKRALASIGKVIAASAATVAVTFLAMVFTKLPVFSTVGPALAIAVAVAFVAAVTVLPAIMVLAGRRGWIKPRRDLTTRFWRRSGVRIVRRPKIHLVASLMILVTLASCATLAHYNYDDRKTLPSSVESTAAYQVMAQHFPLDSIIPQYLFIQSPHDLRNPKALADMEQLASRVSQLPGVSTVRGITRPSGESLEQARLAWQAGEVGNKLGDASHQISGRTKDLNTMTDGANQLANALGDLRNQVDQALPNISGLVGALTSLQKNFGGQKSLNDIGDAAKLVTNMRSLGQTLGVSIADVNDLAGFARPILTALDATPVCSLNPNCVNSRNELQRMADARDSGALSNLADLSNQLESTQGTQSLEATTDKLKELLTKVNSATQSLGGGDPGGLSSKLGNLQNGAKQLAEGSRKLADAVQMLVDQTEKMGAGLGDASGFLMAMKYGASAPPMAGFFIPPQVLTRDDFKKAAGIFISPDGHAARYLVQTKLNPFSIAAMDQVNSVINTARQAQPNTTLADAKVSMAGISVGLRDTRDYYNKDFNFIIVTTVVIVFLILIGLLRAIVAPLYLICSVIVSYLSALGIGTIMFQFILGQELHWTVPGLTFIILVAVGADYNLLLISRIRDESPHGVRVGVIRTVGSTGGVITAAGLIFAASMFGLLFASISMMVQAGFVLGMGILLDTFLVRTVTVPAIATLVGRANWWPSRPQQHKSDGVGMRSRLVQIRKAMTPKFATRRRLVTPPTADGPEPTQDDQMTSNGTEPSHPNGERPLETCDQRPAEREPVLAVTPAWRAGRMLHR